MASAQQGRNKTLFKAGKVSIIADTLPAFFLHIMLDLLEFLYPFRPIFAVWVEISNKLAQESLPFCTISAVWVEISGRRLQESLPFSGIFAIWVDISRRRPRESLPFSPILCYLGRDFQPAATGISTLFAGFTLFG